MNEKLDCYYSGCQKNDNEEKRYVKIDDEWFEYTECELHGSGSNWNDGIFLGTVDNVEENFK